jgi:hypothetical protein
MFEITRRNNTEELCIGTRRVSSEGFPARKGGRPRTIIGPLHIQCNQQGERKYLNQLLHDVLSWPYIEPTPKSLNHRERVSIRLQATAATNEYSAFIHDTEFAEVLLEAPTIVMVLPLVYAHWAIVKEWAEPHYLQSFGLVPAGTVVVYTPRNRAELEVCHSLFFESYYFACKSSNEKPVQPWSPEQPERLALC